MAKRMDTTRISNAAIHTKGIKPIRASAPEWPVKFQSLALSKMTLSTSCAMIGVMYMPAISTMMAPSMAETLAATEKPDLLSLNFLICFQKFIFILPLIRLHT